MRFGNVLGSRGSVLIALSAQVAAGGPVTVTDPEVSRYFMLADEAVHLVLQAAVIGRGGEVLVLDMGEPVRIADMARRMAASSGREVDIVFTGLRPGEKLIEDRLGPGENDLRPYHPLISQVPVPPLSADEVTVLDPDADADSLRRELARLASSPSRDGARAIPARSRATTAAGEARETEDSRPVPPPARGQLLGMRSSMRPAQLGQPGHRPVQQPGRHPRRRATVRRPGPARRLRPSRPAAPRARVPRGHATASRRTAHLAAGARSAHPAG